jgi:hydroxyacylglutathione hydrolase
MDRIRMESGTRIATVAVFLVLLVVSTGLAREVTYGSLTVAVEPVGPIQGNCYLLIDRTHQVSIVIDPGAREDVLAAMIDRRKLKPAAILLTHAHDDHLGAARELAAAYSCPILMHAGDEAMARTFGVTATRTLKGGEVEDFNGLTLKVLSLPGHSAGSVGYLYEPSSGGGSDTEQIPPLLFSGDTVFAGGGVGRTFAPGDDVRMFEAIQAEILPLPDETRVFPGHGDATTLAEIRPGLEAWIAKKLGPR